MYAHYEPISPSSHFPHVHFHVHIQIHTQHPSLPRRGPVPTRRKSTNSRTNTLSIPSHPATPPPPVANATSNPKPQLKAYKTTTQTPPHTGVSPKKTITTQRPKHKHPQQTRSNPIPYAPPTSNPKIHSPFPTAPLARKTHVPVPP